jgi:hypothetical protein
VVRVGEGLRPTTSAPAATRAISRPRAHAVGLLAVLLAVLAAATLVAAAYAVVVPEQLDEGEPLIYGLAARIIHHQPLYQPIDRQPFVQVHYTPLYYLAVAVLHRYVGPGFAPGRLLSLASGLVAAGLIGYVAAARARSWWAGGFAALMFVALAFPGGPAPFLALYRVDVLGVASSIAAIAVLAHRTDRLHLVTAGVLAGLALLTKQSLFAAAVAGTVWLATVDRRRAGLFGLAAAATVLVPGLALQWTSGGAFWDNVGPANPSPTALQYGEFFVREVLVYQGVPALLAAWFVVRGRAWRDASLRLLVLYWLASAVSIAGVFKVGANHNYWIEFAAANAVLATLAIRDALTAPRLLAAPPILLLALCLGVLTPARLLVDRGHELVPDNWTLHLDQFRVLAQGSGIFDELVEQVGGQQGIVLAESMDVAVLANQPVRFEPFAFSMLEQQGRWDSRPLVDDICAGKVDLLVLSYPIESDIHPVGLKEYPMWPNSVMAALRDAMRFEQIKAYHWLYRPKRPRSPADVAACQRAATGAAGR